MIATNTREFSDSLHAQTPPPHTYGAPDLVAARKLFAATLSQLGRDGLEPVAEALGLEVNEFSDVSKLAKAVFDVVRNVGEEDSNQMMENREVDPDEQDLVAAENYASKWLAIIAQDKLDDNTAKWVVKETIQNFGDHFNQGWLDYRKSATVGGDFACTEWRGEKAEIEDVLGRKYIDCLGGYGLFSLGWNNQEVLESVSNQLKKSAQCSQELLDPLRGVLCKLLAMTLPGKIQYAFLVNSGAEAVEGALKLAKVHTGKTGFITATKAFHGKSMGALSVSGKAIFREPVGSLYGGPVYHIPYGDAEAVEWTLESCEVAGVGIAAVIMEPIQGEAGAIVPPDDFWPRIRLATIKYKCLLIADEVQTGLGRTGKLWGVDWWGVEPDIICLGKSLGGGILPISAFCSTKEIWERMMYPNPFLHTTTTGGNPLACAAAIAAIRVTVRDKIWDQASIKGQYILDHLHPLVQKYNDVLMNVTGRGLLIGMHFHDTMSGYLVASGLFRRGVLIAGTLNSAQTIRIEPPFCITFEQLDQVFISLDEALQEARIGLANIKAQKNISSLSTSTTQPAVPDGAQSAVTQ